MEPRVLIIDDAAYFRLLVRHMLQSAAPGMRLTEYDPVVKGRPGTDFDWSQFDVLLLDYKLGEEDGLDWFRAFHNSPDFPATIMFTGEGNESLAVMAMKLGIDDYLPKADLNPEKLLRVIQEAVEARSRRREASLEVPKTMMMDMGDGKTHYTQDLTELEDPIEGYAIHERIGAGATATAFLAKRESDGAKVVLKVLNPELKDQRALFQRFMAEYRLISELDNRHVVKIHEQGFTEDCCYIAMEYFSAGDLRKRIDSGMSAKHALLFLAQMTVALHHMHKVGIIHRDIKPENIMFRDEKTLALVDFGIARQLEHDAGLTRHGELFGTPHYISPEQISGERPDERCDLYSLGVVFYEMLTGERPHQADSLYNLFYKQIHEPVKELAGDLAVFNPLVEQLLARKPVDRFDDAAQLYAAIQELWGRV